MKFKLTPLATVLLTVTTFSATNALAEDNGWSVNAYGMSNYRLVDEASSGSDFGKSDYRTVGTFNKSANQVEATVKKHAEYDDEVYSDFVVRAEYGNGDTYYYSSAGGEHDSGVGQFEVKESYILLGNLPYLGEDTQVWAGRRFLNRSSGILSQEFWKQSSGVGAGFEKSFSSNGTRAGIALVSTDPDKTASTRTTLTSTDLYYYGVKALGGSLDFDLKFMKQANVTSDTQAHDGIGGSVTYNRDYYGFDGWTQTGIGYGNGIATNRGVNFGSWSSGFSDDAKALFVTSYGVANISDKWQFGSEITYFAPDNVWGQDSVERILVAARPVYKANNNLRLEFTLGAAQETLGDGSAWGRNNDSALFYTAEFAPVLTVNADYWGRPQIKPYISYIATDDESNAGSIGITDGDTSQVMVGVQAEIWF